MVAGWALYALIRFTPFSWLGAVGLSVWRLFGAPDRIDLTCMVVVTMAATGSACYAIRRFRSDTAGLVLEAIIATRKPPNDPGLRLVDPASTPATPPPRHHSLG